MMSAHRTVQQFGPSRRSPFRFAAAALCTAFVLMAASGCTPMRKQGAVPTFPASTMNDAVEAYQKGDCRESIRRFSAALQQQEHPALLNGLGMAYLSCNQPRNAAQAFERAVSISPGSAALHANAGTALYADNDYKSAERQFDAALRIDPTNPEALVGKAGILIQRKEPEKALRQLSLVSGTEAPAFGPSMMTSSVGPDCGVRCWLWRGGVTGAVCAAAGPDGAGPSEDFIARLSRRRRARDGCGLNASMSLCSDRTASQTKTHSRIRNPYLRIANVSSVITESRLLARGHSCSREEAQNRMRVRPMVMVLPSSSVAAGT